EALAVLVEPHERGALHHQHPRVADRHDIVFAWFVLEDRPLAEPASVRRAGKGHGLAVTGDGADLHQSADDPGPVIEPVAAMADIAALGELPLDDPTPDAFDLVFRQFAGPYRRANDVFPCVHLSSNAGRSLIARICDGL